MEISKEEIAHLASLTRIAMTEAEIELMRDQMSNILDSISVLKKVNTDGIEPTSHSINVISVMRDDESAASMVHDEVLANAPLTESGFIRVRAVLE